MLDHGGRLRQAARRYDIALADWLDLSTGINPNGWPVPVVPAQSWLRLPEDDDGLQPAAEQYYGASSLLAVAGSQAAIQILPRLRSPGTVAVIAPGYAEHAHAWRQSGHRVLPVAPENVDDVIPQTNVLVLVHPNNPTGTWFGTEQLLDWHAQLATRNDWLIVDEAFVDATPERSLAPFTPRAGLIVLRSLGKFFGLAGARMGFVLAERNLLDPMHSLLGPWSVSGPTRWVAARALADRGWQQTARQRLTHASERLAKLLARHRLAPSGGCALFQWVRTGDALPLHERLARRGVLVRLLAEPPSLRFGLPANEADWARLDTALREATTP